jgi:hypothetical protein
MKTKLLKKLRKRFIKSYNKPSWHVYDQYSAGSITCETTHAAVYYMVTCLLPSWRIAKWVRKVIEKNGGWGKHAISWHRDFTYFDK